MSLIRFNLLVSLLLTVVYNLPLWKALFTFFPPYGPEAALFLSACFILLVAFFYACLTLLSWRRWHKIFIILILLINAAVLYFMQHFAIVIDSSMIENVVQTDPNEAGELLSLPLFFYIILLGIFPAYFAYKLNVHYPMGTKPRLRNLASILISVLLIGSIIGTQFQSFSSLIRNHKEVRYTILPNNYIRAVYVTVKNHLPHVGQKKLEPVAITKNAPWQKHDKKTLFVFVVGETARADNFSLNGYTRDTNPLLKKLDIINLPHMHSCGTSTAASLPCMFSAGGRADPDPYNSPNNLYQLISRSGMNVAWIDNNSGCKGICDGKFYQDSTKLEQYKTAGDKDEPHDMMMLRAMDDYLKSNKGDAFIILHQKGSHGPAYYQRTPESFWKFQPICKTAELQSCSMETIRNSFDNTILYTDYFLAELIGKLKSYQNYNTAMLYVSDHGESLGEHGLYLHGLPYSIAPDQQKHVPFIIWFSKGFEKTFRLNANCLQSEAKKDWTHDNLYHSILDMLDLQSPALKPDLSLAKDCRSGA